MKKFTLFLSITITGILILSTYVFFENRSHLLKYRTCSVEGILIYESTIDLLPGSGTPHQYSVEVDFRIIVLVYNRAKSMHHLLKQLNYIEMDGHSVSLEIWIDRSRLEIVNGPTLKTAVNFNFTEGSKTVRVQDMHVGIYGQWIDTWRSRDPNRSKEIAVILEDDLSVSPYIYRWLRAIHSKYSNQPHFAGATIASDGVYRAHNNGARLYSRKNHTVYAYACVGTWGFSPSPRVWNGFQDWYHEVMANQTLTKVKFHPYVEGIVPTNWYRSFESSGTEDSMWEMWFIYYANLHKLYTVYNNIRPFYASFNNCLSFNRHEPGLHYGGSGGNIGKKACGLMDRWETRFVADLPDDMEFIDWNGDLIKL